MVIKFKSKKMSTLTFLPAPEPPKSTIAMFGGQDFIAGYCGPDEQLSQDV